MNDEVKPTAEDWEKAYVEARDGWFDAAGAFPAESVQRTGCYHALSAIMDMHAEARRIAGEREGDG